MNEQQRQTMAEAAANAGYDVWAVEETTQTMDSLTALVGEGENSEPINGTAVMDMAESRIEIKRFGKFLTIEVTDEAAPYGAYREIASSITEVYEFLRDYYSYAAYDHIRSTKWHGVI